MNQKKVASLAEVLDRVQSAAQKNDPVTMEEVMDAIGKRSFGPLLLMAGLVVLAPLIGDIPGVPTLTAVFVFLISIQLLFNRSYFWMPRWLLNRSLKAHKVLKAAEKSRRPAKFVDRILQPRLPLFITGPAGYAVAAVCLLISIMLPPMELIPFSANIAGAALTLFGLAYVGRDGLVALLAFGFTLAGVAALVYGFI